MGPGIPLSEEKMLENLERRWDRGQRENASRCFGRTTGLGKTSGSTRPGKDEY